jgi:hypothetical protein
MYIKNFDNWKLNENQYFTEEQINPELTELINTWIEEKLVNWEEAADSEEEGEELEFFGEGQNYLTDFYLYKDGSLTVVIKPLHKGNKLTYTWTDEDGEEHVENFLDKISSKVISEDNFDKNVNTGNIKLADMPEDIQNAIKKWMK